MPPCPPVLVLFDHGTPKGLARPLPGHTIHTAQGRGWDRLRPAALSSTHRFRLTSDHLLVGCRGVTLRAYRSSSRRLMRLSIHPKQSASRTVSS